MRRWVRLAIFALLGFLAPRPGPALPVIPPFTLDPAATYHVRDLFISRGDVKIYLSEGLLSFFAPVDGRIVGAVFSAEDAESGDGEVLALLPVRSERSSLASFTGSPNFNEHIRGALLFFADDSAAELRTQIQRQQSPLAPNLVVPLRDRFEKSLREITPSIDFRLMRAFLDRHAPADGFFYAAFFGRSAGQFSFLYEPDTFEPATIGRGVTGADGVDQFQIWAAWRSNRLPAFIPPPNRFSNYRIDANIQPDLLLDAKADFDCRVTAADHRVLRFDLADRLTVIDASIDNQPAEVFRRPRLDESSTLNGGAFLLVSTAPLSPGPHHISVHYRGSVIRQTSAGTYFVDDRTSWYPYSPSLLSTFDLFFHCPSSLQLVATGEPLADQIHNGIRTVHRHMAVPRPFAGFNLGSYRLTVTNESPYRIEVYSDANLPNSRTDLPVDTARILRFYTDLWHLPPSHTLAISPISGYFGQGFPGLVYLSAAAYTRPETRPPALQTSRFSTFLNRVLLPHEIAHQWWGNMMFSANYRSGWLIEALASYSALQFIEHQDGSREIEGILDQYRSDLLKFDGPSTVESAGSLDWGTRLLNSQHPDAWQPIVYEKGTWVLHMLRARLGDRAFLELQRRLLARYSLQPFTNDDVRVLAAELLPASTAAIGARDPDLRQFFDTWVYDAGIPTLRLKRESGEWMLEVKRVDNDFSVDVPLLCVNSSGKPVPVVVRASLGENPFPQSAKSLKSCSLPLPSTFLYTKE